MEKNFYVIVVFLFSMVKYKSLGPYTAKNSVCS